LYSKFSPATAGDAQALSRMRNLIEKDMLTRGIKKVRPQTGQISALPKHGSEMIKQEGGLLLLLGFILIFGPAICASGEGGGKENVYRLDDL